MIDAREVIVLEQENRWRMRQAKLERELSECHQQIGRCVALLKECHATFMHPNNSLAIQVACAIREVDKTGDPWEPTQLARKPWPTNGELGTTRLKERKR